MRSLLPFGRGQSEGGEKRDRTIIANKKKVVVRRNSMIRAFGGEKETRQNLARLNLQ